MPLPHLSDQPPANKGKTYPPEVLEPEEIRALLRACPTNSAIGLRNRALITVLYRAGLRISEALALYPKDIDHRIGAISVLHGKGDRRRTVGIDGTALGVIDAWLTRRHLLGFGDTTPLFCTLRGTQLTPSTVRHFLPTLARRAGIAKRVHPHGLRHTHAFELMMEGVPMRIIQQQLGHTSLATTDRYLAHIAPREVIEAMQQRDWTL